MIKKFKIFKIFPKFFTFRCERNTIYVYMDSLGYSFKGSLKFMDVKYFNLFIFHDIF